MRHQSVYFWDQSVPLSFRNICILCFIWESHDPAISDWLWCFIQPYNFIVMLRVIGVKRESHSLRSQVLDVGSYDRNWSGIHIMCTAMQCCFRVALHFCRVGIAWWFSTFVLFQQNTPVHLQPRLPWMIGLLMDFWSSLGSSTRLHVKGVRAWRANVGLLALHTKYKLTWTPGRFYNTYPEIATYQ